MPGFSEFLNGDELLEFPVASPAWTGRAMQPAVDTARVLAIALAEIETLGRLIGATTSVVIAMESNDANPYRKALLAYLPPAPELTIGLAAKLVETTFDVAILECLNEFHSRLNLARSMTVSFCRSSGDRRQNGGIHIEVLSGAWRELSAKTAWLIEVLRCSDAMGVSLTSRRKGSDVLSILAACANGQSPCVMKDGSIEVPGLAERRQEIRWTVDWSAKILLGPSEAEACIRDISCGGACLRTSELLRVGEGICIQASFGRILAGVIVWKSGDDYGIRFVVRLAADDLIVLAAKAIAKV